MFEPVASSVSFPKLEEHIIRFWRAGEIYEKSLAARAGAPPFVFYEGPPTANGLPHPGHCLTRAIKDLFPRYKTMRGYRCDRKAGWDTHGLPVEVEVCKELGIHAKEEIESYGVEPFIHKCVESVFRYMRQWEELTERLGFWIHLDEAYVTFHQSYVESVWWALKTLFDRGLLYQGHKIVWWWAQGGTALSSGEVGQGYREVADPSVYVRFPLVDQPHDVGGVDLLVWTTTPWTLPSNQFAAVKPDLDYSVVRFEGESRLLILASALIEQVAHKIKREATVVATLKGQEIIGWRYLPPFDYYYKTQGQTTGRLKAGGREHIAWRVVPAEFVTVDTGSGIVHQAPAYGEVDYDVLLAEQARFVEGEGPPLINAVAPDGAFTADAPDYQGRWVKEADRDIIRDMKARGLLFHQEQYVHDYPFCWRAEEDPLIQYPRKSWFIRTTQFRDQMLANNGRIHWLPEHIRDGRFGNFLETNVDWALSRERYWGTPLPIWVCEETGYMEAVGSYDELRAKPGAAGFDVWEAAKRAKPGLPDHLRIHKPYIDAVTYDSPKAPGKRMRRVGDVIDCWFDSGAMPFAQWGYPNQPGSQERLLDQFPADFISEAIDQTRGWFYSLLAISTLLFSEDDKGVQGSGFGDQDAKPQAAEQSPLSPLPSPFDSQPSFPYPHPFRNCVVLGLMLGEDGGKMSKSKRNYREPNEIFDRYGADALRWYFFSNQPPWTSIRYSEPAIKETIPEFLLRLWNVYSFFVIYANIDGFDPVAAKGCRPLGERSELDRWILSELNRTAAAVVERMDDYDNYGACQHLTEFVDALSNWYVRRSRDRFWSGEATADKADAHWTLYECLLTTCKLIAPFVPFLAEAMWQNLAVEAFRCKDASAEIPRREPREQALREKAEQHGLEYINLNTVTVPRSVLDLVPEIVARENVAIPLRESSGKLTVVISDPMDIETLDSLRFRLNREIEFALAPREVLLAAIDRHYGKTARSAVESVHLCDYPAGDASAIDETLSDRMARMREIVSLGLSARMGAKLKVRQPLSRIEVVLADRAEQPWLEEHAALICSELNVKAVEFVERAEQYITYTILPDLKRLGPRLGKRLPVLRKMLSEANGARLLAEMEAQGHVTLELPDGPVTLDADDLQVRLQAKEGWAAAQGRSCVVVLSTELSTDLIREGLARELARAINDLRKDKNLQFTDRIEVGIVTDSAELRAAIEQFRDYIMSETLAVKLSAEPLAGVEPLHVNVGDHAAALYIRIANEGKQ